MKEPYRKKAWKTCIFYDKTKHYESKQCMWCDTHTWLKRTKDNKIFNICVSCWNERYGSQKSKID